MASARVVADIAPLQAAAAMDEKDQDHVEHAKALERMLDNARSATDKEHKMTLMQGIKLYPKAIFWSVLISSTIIMVRHTTPLGPYGLFQLLLTTSFDRRATTCV
jgi:hypothetical protein